MSHFDEPFDIMPDMLCVATVSGAFEKVNPSFARVLGRKVEELLSMPLLEFVHEDDRAKTQAVIVDLAAGGKIVGFKNRYRRADGSYVQLDWNAVMSPITGKIFATARPICEAGCNCAMAYGSMSPGDVPATQEATKAVLMHTRLVAEETSKRLVAHDEGDLKAP